MNLHSELNALCHVDYSLFYYYKLRRNLFKTFCVSKNHLTILKDAYIWFVFYIKRVCMHKHLFLFTRIDQSDVG